MLENIIRILLFISLVSCNNGTKITENKIKNNELNQCHLVQRMVDISPTFFQPFDDVYKDFNYSSYPLDILVKQTGQLSEVNRLYQIESGKFRFLKYNKSGLVLDEIIQTGPIELETEIGDYAFLCNEGASDLGTHVYILKKDGKVITNLWIENGDFMDLSTNDLDMYDKLKELIQLFHK